MRKTLLCIAVAGGLIIGSSCVNLKKLQTFPAVGVEVADRYIVRNGNNMDVDMVVRVPEAYTNLHTGILVSPVMVSNGAEHKLPPVVVVNGSTYERFNDRMDKLSPWFSDKAGVRFSYDRDGCTVARYSTSVAYADWMRGAKMYADVYGGAYTRNIFLGRFPVTGGMLDLSSLIDFRQMEKYYYADPLDRRVIVGGTPEEMEKLAQFAVGSSNLQIDPTVANAVRKHIAMILEDPKVTDYLVSVVVSNSPEGTLESNRRLGQARKEAIRDFLISTNIPENKITFTVNDEGWDELVRMLPSLGLQDQVDIERIIRTTPNLDHREALIRQSHPSDYQKILRGAYPLLRYGRVTVSTQYVGMPGKTYVYTFGDLMSGQFELNSFVISDGTPLDIHAINVEMLDHIKAGNLGEAVKLADRIPNVTLPEFIYSNKGMVLLRAGRTDEAKVLFQRAPSIPEARYNAGVLQLLEWEYDRAADNLAAFSDINAAIAALYAGRNTEALEMLLLQPAGAERNYLLAMTYARLGNNERARQMLSSAISLSPALREKAANEPDFYTVGDEAGFGTVIGNMQIIN